MICTDLEQNVDDWVRLNTDNIEYQVALEIILQFGINLNDEELKTEVSSHDLIMMVAELDEGHIECVMDKYRSLTDPYN